MARYPKIDQPCPLDVETRTRIQGDCSRCGKTVHCLDGKSDAERADFMRMATGPVCVSYRLTAGIGAVLALSLAGPAMAADPAETAPNPPALTAPQTATQGLGQTTPATNPLQSPVAPVDREELQTLDQLVFVGGISKPDEAEWVETDESLPELPMRREAPARD